MVWCGICVYLSYSYIFFSMAGGGGGAGVRRGGFPACIDSSHDWGRGYASRGKEVCIQGVGESVSMGEGSASRVEGGLHLGGVCILGRGFASRGVCIQGVLHPPELENRQYASYWNAFLFLLFSHSVPSQLILKYAYMLDVLIHRIVYMEYFDDTLPILLKL